MKNKLYIHIHIPKTAGRFIKEMYKDHSKELKKIKIFYPFMNVDTKDLKGDGRNFSIVMKCHYNISFLEKYVPSIKSSNIQLFSIVRNPYDRIYSLWKYCKNTGSIGSSNVPLVPEDFETFIYELCDDEYLGCYMMQSQLFYLKGMEKYNVKILKFENMNTEVKDFLTKECELIWSEEKVNESSGKNYREVYTPKMVDLVREKYKLEFETFGYSLDL